MAVILCKERYQRMCVAVLYHKQTAVVGIFGENGIYVYSGYVLTEEGGIFILYIKELTEIHTVIRSVGLCSAFIYGYADLRFIIRQSVNVYSIGGYAVVERL